MMTNMVIKPRSLEEIAAEQESAVKVDSPASRPAPAPSARRPEKGEPWFEPPEEATITPGAPSASKGQAPPEASDLWDPFPAAPQATPSPFQNAADAAEDDDPPRRSRDPWVPPEEPTDPLTRLRNWGLALMLIAATFAAVWLAFNLNRLLQTEPVKAVRGMAEELIAPAQPIRVSITLINECPFHERAFMAKVMPDGPTAEFSDGKASLQAMPNQRIKLLANARFPDFHYETGSIPVKPEITLTANCDNMEERAKAISDSLRDAFKK